STSGSIGLGFAIPSNLVQRITGELIDAGEATHGLLGVTVMDTTSDDNIPQKQILGASVQSVTAGGAAGAAGVRVGDIITGFNGLPITGSIDLTAQVRAAAPGSEATVTFVRSGESRTVTVTLGELS
ncbi:MAG TPA: PDZ domain-containing protein, partial [Terrimesophilobacter sp.]|nr:PDZ domain-containing protein [Terrimesophilobacter sp.]